MKIIKYDHMMIRRYFVPQDDNSKCSMILRAHIVMQNASEASLEYAAQNIDVVLMNLLPMMFMRSFAYALDDKWYKFPVLSPETTKNYMLLTFYSEMLFQNNIKSAKSISSFNNVIECTFTFCQVNYFWVIN